MQRTKIGLLLLGLLTLHQFAYAGAWGRTFAIEIHAEGLNAPLVIADPAIVKSLSFWVGPGTGFSDLMTPPQPELSIVDWGRGEVLDKPAGLPQYEVRFLLGARDNPSKYVVLYEPDLATDSGYIYYPKESSSIVAHRVSETWRYASKRWNQKVGTAIREHVKRQAAK